MAKQAALEATAYHEAGHTVASWRFGFPTDRVTIIPGEDFMGIHEGDSPARNLNFDSSSSPEVLPKVHEAAEVMAVIYYAGPAAQKRFQPHSVRREHGSGDRKEADYLVSLLIEKTEEELEEMDRSVREEMRRRAQGFPPSTRQEGEGKKEKERLEKHAELNARAETFVHEHWKEVEAVAEALQKREELSGEEVTRLLEDLTGEVIPCSSLFDYENPDADNSFEGLTEA